MTQTPVEWAQANKGAFNKFAAQQYGVCVQISNGCAIQTHTRLPLRTAGRIAILNAVKQEHVTVVGAADGNVLHERHLLQLLKHLVNGLEGERLHMFVCVSVSCAR